MTPRAGLAGDPLVSVVIPFRNAAAFLGEAIESVLAQSYGNWEVLLVDDGAVDGGAEIARDYARRQPARIRTLEHADRTSRGASAARNLGIRYARGPLVALLDADDVWLPEKLEEQLAILRDEPDAALVYGTRELWRGWNRSAAASEVDAVVAHGIAADRLYRPPALFLLMFGARRATVPSCSDLMFHRARATRVGGFEDAFRGMYDDQVFLVKLALEEPIYVASRCWTRYRQHPDSCVARWAAAGAASEEWPTFVRWMERYVDLHPCAGFAERRAARHALRELEHPRLARLLALPRRLRLRIGRKLTAAAVTR